MACEDGTVRKVDYLLRLDVGCGHRVRGDVNVDLNAQSTIHRSQNSYTDVPLDMKIPNFVLADSQHLPFRNNVFEKVFSSHVIEHVKKPELMLYEITSS
jgi:ubiquinone/menaquinone biosynthesis C-methylase UbiE